MNSLPSPASVNKISHTAHIKAAQVCASAWDLYNQHTLHSTASEIDVTALDVNPFSIIYCVYEAPAASKSDSMAVIARRGLQLP